MKRQLTKIALAIITALVLALTAGTWTNIAGESNLEMSDSAGNSITNADFSAVGGFSTSPGGEMTVRHQIRPTSIFTPQDDQEDSRPAQSESEHAVPQISR